MNSISPFHIGQQNMTDTWLIILCIVLISWLIIYATRKRNLLKLDRAAIFISGCDSGIGRKLVEEFSDMGCLIFAGCLDPNSWRALPENVRIVPLNVLDEESVKEAVNAVRNILLKEGRELWALVNNAGVCVFGPLEWQTTRQMDWQIDVNLKGTMRMTRRFLPLLRRSKGRIITITSVNASIAYPGLAAYSATKAGLESFSQAIRMELGERHGIQVITVSPGDYSRTTSIMSQHDRHVKEMWNDMSSEEQDNVKSEFIKYNKAVKQYYGLTSPTSFEGSVLLRDVKEALFYENPSSNYISSPFIHRWAYRILTVLPPSCTDFILLRLSQIITHQANSEENGEANHFDLESLMRCNTT